MHQTSKRLEDKVCQLGEQRVLVLVTRDRGARTFLWNISGGTLFILVKDATKTARTKRDGNATAFLSLHKYLLDMFISFYMHI